MTVAVMEREVKNRIDMAEIDAFAAELLTTPKGKALSEKHLEQIREDDDIATVASVISIIYDRGSSKNGPLSYFLMLYELTKYVREKCQEILDEKERINLLEYAEEGEEELQYIVKSKSERESILSQAYQ